MLTAPNEVVRVEFTGWVRRLSVGEQGPVSKENEVPDCHQILEPIGLRIRGGGMVVFKVRVCM